MNNVRNKYISMLEKSASDVPDGAMPLHGVDSQVIANDEHNTNVQDQAAELKGLFNQAEPASKASTKLMNKALPIARKAEDTHASNSLLKTAMNVAFFEGLRRTDTMKTASADYLRMAFEGFNDEFDKIAKMMPSEVMKILAKTPKRKPKLTLRPTGQKSTFQLSKAAG